LEPPCETCKPDDLFEENYKAMQVFERCGDEWMTAGMEGDLMAIPGTSIESALNVSGIIDQRERAIVFDQVKMISRAIVREAEKEKAKKNGKN